MEDKVVPVASKIASQRHLSALRDGLTILIPLTVIGGISLMLANPPVDLETMKPTNVFFQFLIMWKQWANCYADILTIPFNLINWNYFYLCCFRCKLSIISIL